MFLTMGSSSVCSLRYESWGEEIELGWSSKGEKKTGLKNIPLSWGERSRVREEPLRNELNDDLRMKELDGF